MLHADVYLMCEAKHRNQVEVWLIWCADTIFYFGFPRFLPGSDINHTGWQTSGHFIAGFRDGLVERKMGKMKKNEIEITTTPRRKFVMNCMCHFTAASSVRYKFGHWTSTVQTVLTVLHRCGVIEQWFSNMGVGTIVGIRWTWKLWQIRKTGSLGFYYIYFERTERIVNVLAVGYCENSIRMLFSIRLEIIWCLLIS